MNAWAHGVVEQTHFAEHATLDAFPEMITAIFLATVAAVVAVLLVGLWYAHRRDPSGWRVPLLGAAAGAAWLGITAWFAELGVLRAPEWPPPLAGFLAVSVGLTTIIAFSPLGRRLATDVPLAWLVGFQVFRVPVEWALHSLYEADLVPVQMTYAGLNWDVLSGLSAPLVALLVWRGFGWARLVLVWNIAALALLANIVTVAGLSAPTPLRVFTNEPANVFITYPPFVWLPGVLVQAALLGHLLVFRALWMRALQRRAGAVPVGA